MVQRDVLLNFINDIFNQQNYQEEEVCIICKETLSQSSKLSKKQRKNKKTKLNKSIDEILELKECGHK